VLALNKYIGHPWLDAPTHPDYEHRSVFDVFELGSLKDLSARYQVLAAYRIAAHVAPLYLDIETGWYSNPPRQPVR
jgi:hypothetical protein